jgi:hypothetical protein
MDILKVTEIFLAKWRKMRYNTGKSQPPGKQATGEGSRK